MDPLNDRLDQSPKLTDHAVSRLPLHAARAELLEEIVSTDVTERPADLPATAPRHRRWLIPLAAAAVVAGVVGATSLWAGGSGQQTPAPASSTAPTVAASPSDDAAVETTAPAPEATGTYAVLDAPGWVATYAESEGDYASVTYEKGDARFEITRYPASSYDMYVDDREHIVEPPAPGEPVEVAGLAGQMWAYSADDHTVIREVQDGSWLELRGGEMTLQALLEALSNVRIVDRGAFEASLPDRFVTDDERPAAGVSLIDGIVGVTGAGWPDGAERTVDSEEQDPYQLGADVAGAYACAWIEEFAAATRDGDDSRAAAAARLLGTSRDWPVLQEMDAEGDYPEMVWELADQVAAGQVPQGFRGSLGCH
ncbi:hypothetical protein [Nocardioides flavescens]|uniref:Uncharacterized protein n=1 Tax=Nocardioides flavescens TaxID=2691959 RepID=A0A6L7F0T5_9ACTN|nr:hypothetical protein [Nocardioides flavescens]MXG89762.1 hypothetical protein [Nocardioides flavescens]